MRKGCKREEIVATIFSVIIIIIFFPSVAIFSHRMSARIEKLILQKQFGAANNLGLDPFPDPVSHFGAPWRLFRVWRYLIG